MTSAFPAPQGLEEGLGKWEDIIQPLEYRHRIFKLPFFCSKFQCNRLIFAYVYNLYNVLIQ